MKFVSRGWVSASQARVRWKAAAAWWLCPGGRLPASDLPPGDL